MKYDVVVIGAGASGMMAAIQAAKKGSGEGKGGCISRCRHRASGYTAY